MSIRTTPVLDWPGIIAETHRKGMTLTELARRNGLPEGSCRKLGKVGNRKAEKAVADFLGYKPEDLWPDRYSKGKHRILDTRKYPPVASPKVTAGLDKQSAA